MISHGLVSGALFLCVGVVYDRMHTLEIAAYGGLVQRMPLYAVAFMVFTLANVGLPGTSGFIGEFLTLIGDVPGQHLGRALAATRHHPVGLLCALSLPPRHLRRDREAEPDGDRSTSLARDRACCRSWLLMLYYGVHPQPIIDASAASIDALIQGFSTRSRRPRPPDYDGAPALRAITTERDIHARDGHSLPVVLPEAVLAAGVLALVLIGALRGERGSIGWSPRSPSACSALVVVIAGGQARPMGVTFYGAFVDDAFTRFMGARVDRLAGDAAAVGRVHAQEKDRRLRIPGAHPALDARHDDADLGQRLHRALSRPRADEPGALRASRPIAGTSCARPKRASNISSSARCRRACCSTAFR